jgi:hypothetical protein
MATMIAKKCKGDIDTYFFVIDNFVKHANAKGYNRHVAREWSDTISYMKRCIRTDC